MKLVKTGLLASSTLLLAMAGTTAFGEAGISYNAAGTAPTDVTANVKFKISVPEIIILRVGDWADTVNTVEWNFDFGTGLSSASNLDVDQATYNKIAGTVASKEATADDDGTSDGSLAVAAFSNTGSVKLTAASAAGFTVQTAASGTFTPTVAAGSIPDVTKISATGATIAHPTINDTNGVTLTNTAGIVNMTDTWQYSYTGTSTLAAGVYTAEAIYTLANI